MAMFYVETIRPAYPQRGVQYRVHSEAAFSRDAISPDMTAVFQVDACRTKQEALACVIEYAAGHRTAVRLAFGGNAPGVVADRRMADTVKLNRRDWSQLPIVGCDCGQRFRQEWRGQAVCRDCISVADTLAAERRVP